MCTKLTVKNIDRVTTCQRQDEAAQRPLPEIFPNGAYITKHPPFNSVFGSPRIPPPPSFPPLLARPAQFVHGIVAAFLPPGR